MPHHRPFRAPTASTGFGRIGRNYLRCVMERAETGNGTPIEVVAVRAGVERGARQGCWALSPAGPARPGLSRAERPGVRVLTGSVPRPSSVPLWKQRQARGADEPGASRPPAR
ncbi:hypothetical protein GCM10010425_79110 [Streptomyces spororaveus]|uniref:Uncharacterized protein n=1 Tax=Streptomyces spororaveus TaxID=284039 RepID=A0ABQ3TPE4_9ACTN|nr:hypothetical protein Sspor_78450 [Streptomyces spororaveus]